MPRAQNASKPARRRKTPEAGTYGKIDLYSVHESEYVTPKTPVFVDVGPARYLTIVGRGEPGGEAFTTAVGALYNVAFTVKMERKFAGTDYTVAKLEGLWWGSEPGVDFFSEPRERWNWQLMIRTPHFINTGEVEDAVQNLVGRGKSTDVERVHVHDLTEGRCVQMLHLGSYDAERASLERMQAATSAAGLHVAGTHHEIYLSDPRRVPTERLRTILRLPVR